MSLHWRRTRRGTGAEVLCHTPEDAADNVDTLAAFWGIQTDFPASPRSATHTQCSRLCLISVEDQAVKVCHTRWFGNSGLLITMKKETPLDRPCPWENWSHNVPYRTLDLELLRQQKDQLNTALNISQSIAFGEKKKFLFILVLRKA